MSEHADASLARAWRRSGAAARRQPEGFLEDALAAALDSAEGWSHFRAICSREEWDLPEDAPAVTTQDRVDDRWWSDIRLAWPGGPDVVLELKAGGAATEAQLGRYAERGRVRVVSIATTEADCRADWFLGSLTWAALRNAAPGPEASLPWRQLIALIDAVGVAMPRLDQRALEGLAPTLEAWPAVEAWTREATSLVVERLSAHGRAWTRRNANAAMDRSHRRFAAWTWPEPWRADAYAVYVGLYFGKPALGGNAARPTVETGIPDLTISTHLKPAAPRARHFGAGSPFEPAVERWLGRGGEVVREHRPGEWDFLVARTSAGILLDAADQRVAFLDWVASRLEEWQEDGISAALAAAAEEVA